VTYLDVPGARLYYEQRGDGPLLLLIGSPMDSTGFSPLAEQMASRHTVVTYDPRGLGESSRDDAGVDVTPEQQADDVRRIISSLDAGPAAIFGSSGGATVGLALVTADDSAVHTLVAHEPPVVRLLPDHDEVRAQFDDVYATFRAEGMGPAMGKFMAYAGFANPSAPDAGPAQMPSPEQMARMQTSTEVFLAHFILATTRFQPDLEALGAARTRIVVAGGTTSKGQLAQRSAVALADQLGTPVVDFPGDHGGFLAHPAEFARVLEDVLAGHR
jgi:pimeloyl-ACP methyl ester carboxylesterase